MIDERRIEWIRPMLLVCAWAVTVAIAVLSLMPIPAPSEVPGSDKFAHFLAYGTLAIIWGVSLRQVSWWGLWLACSAYGGGIECLQGMTDHRMMEFADAVANTTGAALGTACYWAGIRPVLRRLLETSR